ncbi:E3 ubiquitin-protein ligase UHRF1-like [Artemia franciscana]|uniref:E3 ubiquitin-protein ligase UHRF1-like n=1 Tax=Artemia franciscana TaxID=6661 RepID=UPI0032DABA37
MYIRIKKGHETKIISASKQMTIGTLRKIIQEKFFVPPSNQRLFFAGKQLENGCNLLDYKVNVNDVIILMDCGAVNVRKDENKNPEKATVSKPETLVKSKAKKNIGEVAKPQEVTSKYFQIGDLVDAHDPVTSSWNESKITCIVKGNPEEEDGLLYWASLDSFPNEDPIECKLSEIRPRAHRIISVDEVTPGMRLMVNYNLEKPSARGLWYDSVVSSYNESKRVLKVSLLLGMEKEAKMDVKIVYVDELYRIEEVKEVSARTDKDVQLFKEGPEEKRKYGAHCENCEDHPRRKCTECGCNVCGEKKDPNLQVMCDECDHPFHIYCLDPPLEEIPEDDWYCPDCKTDDDIVKAGDKVKESRKRNLASKKNEKKSNRDWGQGFATAGRQKICTIVKPDHFGPIPGVEVGQSWLLRVSCSESGVHRPPVSGIHGKEKDGAYSVVLAGGYEDDEDRGEEFTYTGSGGRDLSGNKRTAAQSFDQELTRSNKAIALNCNAKFDSVNGAEASDWRGGKPVRVIRSYKAKKHSPYAPDEGVRYDGIYKVVKYWPERGHAGFIVWRYLMRRDDPSPAPWTIEGKARINQMGLKMVYPEGYLEYMAEKENSHSKKLSSPRASKRKLNESPVLETKNAFDLMMGKRSKQFRFALDPVILELIAADKPNEKGWNDCLQTVAEGRTVFLESVSKQFDCVCCCDLVKNPVTTPCGHNICKICLERSFSAKMFTCPVCRYILDSKYEFKVNKTLKKALNSLFPNYDDDFSG